TVLLCLDPAGSGATLPSVGSPWGWAALLAALGAAVAGGALRWQRLSVGLVDVALVAVACMLALTATTWDVGNWLGYHVLMASHAAAACATLGAGWLLLRRRTGWSEPAAATAAAPATPDEAGGAVAPGEASAASEFSRDVARAGPRPQSELTAHLEFTTDIHSSAPNAASAPLLVQYARSDATDAPAVSQV